MGKARTLSVLDLPDSLLLKVFMSLPLQSVYCVSLTCFRFSRITCDDKIWKTMFQRDFKVPQSVPLRPKASSWWAEYRRLYDESPAVLCEEVLGHRDEVSHVSFSHNGKMFATCSKDGTVKVWNAITPCRLRFSADMKARFTWRNASFTQFNKSGTLLLVFGVLDIISIRDVGKVAVLDLKQDLKLVGCILNTAWYGAWYDDCHILTGTSCNVYYLQSSSAVWLTQASREVRSERKYATINPFRFENCSRDHVLMMIVADVTTSTDESQSPSDEACAVPTESDNDSFLADSTENHAECVGKCSYDSTGATWCAHHSVLSTQDITASLPTQKSTTVIPGSSRTEKLLIFTLPKGAKSEHVVGIKRMTEEEIREEEEAREGHQWVEIEDGYMRYTNRDIGGSGRMTDVDYTFNMHGKIIGVALSPDQRYLYVNCRRWLFENTIEKDWMPPPPVRQDIELHVIDLVTFTKLDTVLRSHTELSPTLFHMYLDVNDVFVVSGSEDNQGYMWDRHYGVHVRCFPHDEPVSCCAFNPMDPEMLVTVSDDKKIKIWRSWRQMQELLEKTKVPAVWSIRPPPTLGQKVCMAGCSIS